MGLLHTPLFDEHLALGARMIAFDGFEMPVQYTSIIDEHLAVRERVGVFDVSHMGEIELVGRDAIRLCDYLLTNTCSDMGDGDIKYSPMCYPNGGQVDDLFVYRLGRERVLLVVNASPDHSKKDLEWIEGNANGFEVRVINRSPEYGELAIQGPMSAALLESLSDSSISPLKLKRFRFLEGGLIGKQMLISRTGYTGEDGFEVFCRSEDVSQLWEAVLKTGKSYGVLPCGLGARDTLRFEVCYWLYGNDIDESINPLETGQGWTVKFTKEDFIGRDALREVKLSGVKRRLCGLHVQSGGIARHGMKVATMDGQNIGFVTSGNYCPSLKGVYAMALLAVEHSGLGARLTIDIRGREAPAEIVPMPFVAPVNKR